MQTLAASATAQSTATATSKNNLQFSSFSARKAKSLHLLAILTLTLRKTNIYRMRSSTIQRQIFLTIAWCLTGLLLVGSLLSSLPACTDSVVFAEERALEVDDDDRSNSIQLDVALHLQVDERPDSQTWQELQVFYFAQTIAAISSAHFSSRSRRRVPAEK